MTDSSTTTILQEFSDMVKSLDNPDKDLQYKIMRNFLLIILCTDQYFERSDQDFSIMVSIARDIIENFHTIQPTTDTNRKQYDGWYDKFVTVITAKHKEKYIEK